MGLGEQPQNDEGGREACHHKRGKGERQDC